MAASYTVLLKLDDVLKLDNVDKTGSAARADLGPDAPSARVRYWTLLRDGFAPWAFAFPPLWLACHRLWLPLIGMGILTIVSTAALAWGGAPIAAYAVINVAVGLVVALEGPRWLRVSRETVGWVDGGAVYSPDRITAEEVVAMALSQSSSIEAAYAVSRQGAASDLS